MIEPPVSEASDATGPSRKTAETERPNDWWHALRVLVIDDQIHVRRWMCDVLHRMGITLITEASDGRSALTMVAQPGVAFDLILCDLNMPDYDGIETIRAFVAMRLKAAIVILSVEPDRVVDLAGLLAEEQGPYLLGTLAKPLSEEKLQPLLLQLADRRFVEPL
jgi:CheY-like chemotaxis protein